MGDPSSVLLVEDNPGDAELVNDLLIESMPALRVLRAERIADALQILNDRSVDVVLLDLSLPDSSGLDGLQQIRAAVPRVPVVVLTGSANRALGETALYDGAQDYLLKGKGDGEGLATAIRYAVLRQQVGERERQLAREHALRLTAEERVQVLDDFLSIASHELRTPVSALSLGIEHTQRVLAGGAQPAVVASGLARASRQIARLMALIDQLLDLSRLRAGGFQLERRKVDLAEAVKAVVDRLAPAAEAARCALLVEAHPGVIGHWDGVALEQVIGNLLSNALKYGAGKPVSIAMEKRGAVAELSVSDQGIGIDPVDVDRIFHRFERAASSRHYGGLGLGLYIAQRIAAAHGGALRVRSERGAGATFTLTLPCVAADGAAPR